MWDSNELPRDKDTSINSLGLNALNTQVTQLYQFVKIPFVKPDVASGKSL